MKIALVHDYLKEFGGAERVLEALHEVFPQAPVYTSLYLPKFLGPHQERFRQLNIRSQVPPGFPFLAKLISPLRVLSPLIFKRINLNEYDVVIVSATGAYFPNCIQKGKAIHICYCHTPPRYLYGYSTAREWKKNVFFRIIGEIANHFLRLVDYESAQNVDYFVANSQEVQRRIKKFYRKESVVIYPPVDIPNIPKEIVKENFYLTGGRLTRAKRIDLAIDACTKLDIPLVVFGREFAGYGRELRESAGPNVEFKGEVTEQEFYSLSSRAKALIFPSQDEDFGITPVSAMAAGTPVIALRSGGVQESVIENKTGIFFDEPTIESLITAIKKFETMSFSPADCRARARKFSKEVFKRNIIDFVSSKIK